MGEQGSLLDADRGPGSLPIDTTPTIQLLPKKTPGPPAGQARPRKTFLVHPWPPARHQAAPRMPPAPKALEMSDKLIDAQMRIRSISCPARSAIPIRRRWSCGSRSLGIIYSMTPLTDAGFLLVIGPG